MADVPALIGAAFNDVLSLFQIPGSNLTAEVLRGAIASYLRRQSEAARDILLEEFRLGNIDRIELASQDELGGVLFRYFNAIRDNAARLNLRLMAKVMVGQAQRDRLYADEFSRYANVLSSLSRDEVLAITFLWMVQSEFSEPDINGIESELWKRLIEHAVPKAFLSEEHARTACTGVMRTGLVISSPTYGGLGYFRCSPLMNEIAQLADFQDALRREGVNVA